MSQEIFRVFSIPSLLWESWGCSLVWITLIYCTGGVVNILNMKTNIIHSVYLDNSLELILLIVSYFFFWFFFRHLYYSDIGPFVLIIQFSFIILLSKPIFSLYFIGRFLWFYFLTHVLHFNFLISSILLNFEGWFCFLNIPCHSMLFFHMCHVFFLLSAEISYSSFCIFTLAALFQLIPKSFWKLILFSVCPDRKFLQISIYIWLLQIIKKGSP